MKLRFGLSRVTDKMARTMRLILWIDGSYRQSFTPSRAKDDPTDADFLCELVALHREQLKALRPDDV
jgi:hypothetical protein